MYKIEILQPVLGQTLNHRIADLLGFSINRENKINKDAPLSLVLTNEIRNLNFKLR